MLVQAKKCILISSIVYLNFRKNSSLDLRFGSLSNPRRKFKDFWTSLVSLTVRKEMTIESGGSDLYEIQ